MPKVFLVNSAGHDYSDAERFGELVVLSSGIIDKFSVTHIHRTFQKYLNKSSPDDFLLQAGPTVMMSIASAILAHKHGQINLLLWKFGSTPRRNGYVHSRLVLDANNKVEEDEGNESNGGVPEEYGELRE